MFNEVKSSIMSSKQRTFRGEYRNQVQGWYSGLLHVSIIYTIGFLLLAYFFLNLSSIVLIEYSVIPITFLFCNFFEWFLHKEVMHKPRNFPGARAIYTRHTLQHHQFFTEKEMRFATADDYRVTFFPPYALIVFSIMGILPSTILYFLFTSNVAWLFLITTTSMYLIYETMHYCCHIEDNLLVRNFPFINTLRRHHMAHHDQKIMVKKNMNLTFPIADWFFDTSDVKRSLLGTLLNGYSKKYIK